MERMRRLFRVLCVCFRANFPRLLGAAEIPAWQVKCELQPLGSFCFTDKGTTTVAWMQGVLVLCDVWFSDQSKDICKG